MASDDRSAGPDATDAFAAHAEFLLSLEDLCRVGAVEQAWVIERVAAGLIPLHDAIGDAQPAAWRFDSLALWRVRRMRGIERDFDAVPELAALVADLFDELERLRAHVARLQR